MLRFSTYTLIAAAFIGIGLSACRKTEIKKEYVSVESLENLAQVGTPPIDSVSYSEAYATCRVYAEGSSAVTECGLCWDTDPSPLRLGSHIGLGQGKGTFKGKLEGLKPSTTYYLRAYAKNSEGISYGNEITFTTSPGWLRYANNPGSQVIQKFFFHNNYFYASTNSRVHVTQNVNQNWTSTTLYSATCFTAKDNIVYTASGSELYFTTNNGSSWTYRYTSNSINDVMVTNAIYLATISGVRKSVDGGINWTSQNSGTSGWAQVLCAKGNDFYLGTSSGIFKSTNSAASWSQVKQGINVQSIKVAGNNLLAGTSQGVYISKDNGATWTDTGVLTTFSAHVYSFDKNVVAWSLVSNYVYVSKDEGLSWKKVLYDSSEQPQSITSDGVYYYGSSPSGIFRILI